MAAALNTMVQVLFLPCTSQALVSGWVPGATEAAEHDGGGMGSSVLVAAFCPEHHKAPRLVKPPRP